MRIEHRNDITYIDFEGDMLVTKREGDILTLKGDVCIFQPYLKRVNDEDFNMVKEVPNEPRQDNTCRGL
jgi:hypothetical protein